MRGWNGHVAEVGAEIRDPCGVKKAILSVFTSDHKYPAILHQRNLASALFPFYLCSGGEDTRRPLRPDGLPRLL